MPTALTAGKRAAMVLPTTTMAVTVKLPTILRKHAGGEAKVDADGATLGRLATRIASMLRGKHKPSFTDHLETTMTVGSKGRYTWHVNQSTRPVVQRKLVEVTSDEPVRSETYEGGATTVGAAYLGGGFNLDGVLVVDTVSSTANAFTLGSRASGRAELVPTDRAGFVGAAG